ncbi:MAG: alkaline phosphatase family protein [Rhizobiales bacterium]|nr:alkaline phosphatase family protein [Hyphomicrobiales bacterium]
MSGRTNVLWIMCDQLRFDYLSCYGAAAPQTPNIDALAARGARFTRAYVQSPVCGPSRMCFYTGRYMRSHGSNWNQFPLKVGEPTLGDALKKLGVRNVLVGKTHMRADAEGLRDLGVDPSSDLGVHLSQCGFEPYERDDGLHPDKPGVEHVRYNREMAARGYDGDNPWHDWANSGLDEKGDLRSGWLLANSRFAARIAEEDSETPYITDRAMEFIAGAKDDARPWCLHVSYIKPHWPYVAPEPYASMYGASDVPPAVRANAERADPHPVYAAFQAMRVSRNFSRDEVRAAVIPAYMGLIKQIDDQIGRLVAFLDAQGLSQTTMIVFTSDHGDYLGDHWLGEKDLFHDCSARIPLIVMDPSRAADPTRGRAVDALVEAIDLAPTFVERFGGTPARHVFEGHSLAPLLRGQASALPRACAISEYDYSMLEARRTLGLKPHEARLFMAFDGRWKYVHAAPFRPMLFDLERDPQELVDLGADPAHEGERTRLKDLVFDWALRDHRRLTISDAEIEAYGPARQLELGVYIGYVDEAEVEEARRAFFGGPETDKGDA